jgi:TnpA family transposase
MRDAPTTAIPKAWRPYVLDENERVVDPRAYVFSIIDAWRTAIKRRDVFTEPGARYGDPRRGLLEGAAWASSQPLICRALNRSLDADLEIEGLTRLLDTAYREVNSRIDTNPDLRIEKVDGKSQIIVTPLDKLEEPDSLKALRAEVARRMPRVDLPDVVLEIMGRTELANAFTHLSERQARVDDFSISLGAALVAAGCNIGFAPMIQESIPALRRERLSWVRQNFIRADTLSAGGALLVAAHNALPLVAHWGAGDVASVDGMRFIAPASAIHAGPNPKYYGQGRGVTWNNMLSNQFSGLNALVVPGTLRDSLVLLALLLEQETELEPLEIMTDTASYSDAVFALFWLLGYQFSPRLADIGGARLWRIDRKADYGQFNALTTGSINVGLIRENWPDLIRLAGSLKLGHLKAAGVMRTLQVKDNPTTLARALSELGRIIKSLHVLRYVDDAAFRRRILTQLNRQELRHRLGRRIFLGERGEIRSSLRQGQEEELGAMGLLLNVVVHWNAIYMQEVITQLKTEGWVIEDADLARLSPLIWRHINFLGRYNFAVPEVVANGGLRPLSNPSSEWDF